jgi:SAM-dependent methyltransferase
MVMTEDNYEQKLLQELEAYDENINVHELPQIFHYWSNKYLLPMIVESGHSSINDFFVKNLIISAERTQQQRPIFLSVGAGNCDTEISIAKLFIDRGFADFKIECLEINQRMLERGKAEAASEGLMNQLIFTAGDFNTWRASRQYAGIFANQSLHHVQDLEHLFSEVKDCLDEMGSFVISDMIGRNGHQRYPKALEIVHEYWHQLPVRQKYNHILRRTEDLYENWDCSNEGFEGIRAQDILPLLENTFF